jgi:hypothetical protein
MGSFFKTYSLPQPPLPSFKKGRERGRDGLFREPIFAWVRSGCWIARERRPFALIAATLNKVLRANNDTNKPSHEAGALCYHTHL